MSFSIVRTFEIGINISGILFGCMTIQTYTYYRLYPRDPRCLKYAVALIWILELAEHIAVSLTQPLSEVSITEAGSAVVTLFLEPSTVSASFFLASCVVPIVETFYTFRIYKFSGNIYRVIIGMIIVWTRFVGWVVIAAEEYRLGLQSGAFFEKWSWLLITLLSMGVATDAVIATTTAYHLYLQRNLAGYPRTVRLIDRLIKWTIQTSVITSVSNLMALIAFLINRDSLAWMAITACLTKIFSNCLLASLNARASIQSADELDSLHLPPDNRLTFAENKVNPIVINVAMEFSESRSTRRMVESNGAEHVAKTLEV